MMLRYTVRTIRSPEVLGNFESKEAAEHFLNTVPTDILAHRGAEIIRWDPQCIKVVHPIEAI